MVDRVHFRRNGNAQTAVPGRFGDRSAVSDLSHPQNTDGGDLAGRHIAARLQVDVSVLEYESAARPCEASEQGRPRSAGQDADVRSGAPDFGEEDAGAQLLRWVRSEADSDGVSTSDGAAGSVR